MERIFVEKQMDFQGATKALQNEMQNYLGLKGLERVRLFNGYDIEGLTEAQMEKAKWTIFAQKGMDTVFENEADVQDADVVLTVEGLPGQYCQRADFATQLLQIQDTKSKAIVRVFYQIALYGTITTEEIEKVKAYYINPVEMREIPYEKPETITPVYEEPKDVVVLDQFPQYNDAELQQCKVEYEISMSLENLKFCQEYYKKENRIPTVTELKIFDTYWSDHCRHSTFQTILEDVEIEDDINNIGVKKAFSLFQEAKKEVYGETERPLCFMDIATMEMKKLKKSGVLSDMEQSDEVNACSIETTIEIDGKPEDYIVMFKNETHNHPTEIEPFGGASTCLGGGIRDPLSGRAHVFGAIRVTGSGDPREAFDATLEGKLPQRKIGRSATQGYSSYGNQIGLASGQLLEFYDPGFKAKRMECGALVGAVPKAQITRENATCGDVIVLVGGATGRDGCGGATGSSKAQDEKALEKNGAEVQKGNPLIERNIVRLFRNPVVSKMIKKCNDFGAGGVSVAVGELAESLLIDLDKVSVKYPGLDGTEIAISESQERMAVLLSADKLEDFCNYAKEENLTATKIAEVTDTNRIVMNWRGKEIVNMSSEFLNSGGVRQKSNIKVATPVWSSGEVITSNVEKHWKETLADLNVCSKKGIANQFDTTASNATVFSPFGGKYQKTPEQGLAMRIPVAHGTTNDGVLMTVGYNPDYSNQSPFHAAAYAVIESIMKIVAMGGDYRKIRLSFQEFFASLGNDPEKWGKPFASLLGAFLVQDELGCPSIGGKDSMSGTFQDIEVPPTLISFAVATVDTTKLVSRSFKQAGNPVVLLTTPIKEDGLPCFDTLKENMLHVQSLIANGMVCSSSVIGQGGLAATISEMAFGNQIGFTFDEKWTGSYFTPSYRAFVLEVPDLDVLSGISYELLGTTTEEPVIIFENGKITLEEALSVWENTLEEVYPTVPETNHKVDHNKKVVPVTPEVGGTSPIVLIPIFPGSIGEYELEKQFKNAGALVETILFKNRTVYEIKESYTALAKAIDHADLVAFPTGMTAGGEPDGTAKLLEVILQEEQVAKAINQLISRNGFVLGLGESFKALLNTGLLTSGKIAPDYTEIFVTENAGNQYYCSLVYSKIVNSENPWFTGQQDVVELVPVTTAEGAVVLGEDTYQSLKNKGQIVAEYIDETPFAGSHKIEAIVSENGQILGRMAAAERVEEGLYTNVAEAIPSAMFTNVINYLKQNKVED